MFKFFSRSKSSKEKVDFSFLKCDMHSHLIPGIDDGSPDMEASLQLIRGMIALGYKKLITTPHVMWDMYKNSPEIILAGLAELRSAVKTESLDIEINAAAEYFLDDHMEELLRDKQPLLPISGNMILVEFSMVQPPMNLKDVLFEMQMHGYQPIIAHPERYTYLERSKEFYDELKNIGCLFQLNLLSLGSQYGRSVHDIAQYLIKKEYYDLVGTDLHHFGHLDALNNPTLLIALKKLFDSGKIKNPSL